jgi:hypothetical protein
MLHSRAQSPLRLVTWQAVYHGAKPQKNGFARAVLEAQCGEPGVLVHCHQQERPHIDLPLVLTDALEEAGLTDAEVLTHLRSAGPQVRGRWALDVMLGLK